MSPVENKVIPILEIRRPKSIEDRYYYIARFTDGKTSPIDISFVDNAFHSCTYDFIGTYTLEEWQILGKIAVQVAVLAKVHAERRQRMKARTLGTG